MEEEEEGLIKLFRIIDIEPVFKIPFQKYKKNRSKMKKRMNIRFIIKKEKKINFDPIQLNQPGEKRR